MMINTVTVKVGERYLAEWWHGYDDPDVEKEEITITKVYPIGTFDFEYKGAMGTTQRWTPNQVRGKIKLIRKIE